MVSADPIYEKLSEVSSIRGLVTASVAIFDESVDQLINRVFRKNDFAVKSVVDSLFETSGPLASLSVRLKVLLGLGVLSQEIFADISAFMQLKDKLNEEPQEYRFSDDLIVAFTHKLHLFKDKSMLPPNETIEAPDSLVGQMKVRRREKLVQSCLILTVTEIYQQLQVESPL